MSLDTTTIRELSAIFRELTGLDEAYLVGGCVRDLLLEKVPVDIDVVVRGKPQKVAEALARKKGLTHFFLDRDREIVRVTGKGKKEPGNVAIPQPHYDVAPLEETSIALNLARRDFTIDAMAIRIQDDDFTVIDPFGGKEDLREGWVRALSMAAFVADPIRLLRAFRLAAVLQFRIDDRTLEWIRETADRVATAAPERIRDEFLKFLALEKSFSYLDRIRKAGLLSHLVPEDHAGMSLSKRVEGIGCLEAILLEPGMLAPSHGVELKSYAEKTVAQGIPVKAILKWIVLHPEAAADRLRLALKTQRLIRKVLWGWSWLCGQHHPVSVTDQKRQFYRYYKAAGEGGLGAILIHRAVSGPEKRKGNGFSLSEMVSWYFNEYVLFGRPLVSGEDLIRVFGLSPGPPLGDILRRVEKERAAGFLRTRQQALQAIREWIAL